MQRTRQPARRPRGSRRPKAEQSGSPAATPAAPATAQSAHASRRLAVALVVGILDTGGRGGQPECHAHARGVTVNAGSTRTRCLPRRLSPLCRLTPCFQICSSGVASARILRARRRMLRRRATSLSSPRRRFPKLVASLRRRMRRSCWTSVRSSASNVAFCGERLGCKLFIEDLVADVDRQLRGNVDRGAGRPSSRSGSACRMPASTGIICWDLFDFLDKAAVAALARQIVRMLKPGGAVMGFFCTTASNDRRSRSTRSSTRTASATAYHPGVGGKKHSLPEPRHHQDVRRLGGLGFVPAEEQYPRDAAPQKGLSLRPRGQSPLCADPARASR